jgi:hypothetical protein
MVGVTGPIPVAPTTIPRFYNVLRHHAGTDCGQLVAVQSHVNRKEPPLAPFGQQGKHA